MQALPALPFYEASGRARKGPQRFQFLGLELSALDGTFPDMRKSDVICPKCHAG
jgi:hypothetical protein